MTEDKQAPRTIPPDSPDDDLLAPKGTLRDGPSPDTDAEDAALEAAEEARRRDPSRSLIRVAWALVAVVAVVGALMFAELLRVNSTIDTNNCIARAQALNGNVSGPGITKADVGLTRLALRNALTKCGS